jgi:peptidoglycan-associated lipoprotein
MNTQMFSRQAVTIGLICAMSLAGCRHKTKPSADLEDSPQPTKPIATREDSGGTREAGTEAVLAQRIGFRFADASLTPDAKAALASKAAVLRATPGLRLRLEGHADERGSAEYNKALGMRRAATAKRYLVQRGIDPSRLYVMSYGKEKPLAREHTESAWSLNRRVEFSIMAAPLTMGR